MPFHLAFRRESVLAVAISFADLAVFAVNEQLGALIFRHRAPGINCLALRRIQAAHA